MRNYAKRQFHDEGVLIEQRNLRFQPPEVQVVADRTGKGIVHFGTRNCSVQSTAARKRIEVAPGFWPERSITPSNAKKVLDDIVSYSLAMAREVGYDNGAPGSDRFAPMGQPFLMEVNTRIQDGKRRLRRIARIRGAAGVDIIAEQIRWPWSAPGL